MHAVPTTVVPTETGVGPFYPNRPGRCIVNRCQRTPARRIIAYGKDDVLNGIGIRICDRDEHVGHVTNMLFEAGYTQLTIERFV